MPRGTSKVPGISNAGAGKPGYCKLCDFEEGVIQNQMDDRTRQGWTPKQLNVWLQRQIEGWKVVSDITVYKHRKHVQRPEDKLVTAVRRTQQRALTVAPKSSPDEFLNAVVSAGMTKVIENPEDVTLDHALRAAQVLKTAKSDQRGGLNVLIGIFTNQSNFQLPDQMIDADYVDVTEAS